MRALLKQVALWITGLALAFVLALGAVIDRFGVADHAHRCDALVVLGARVEDRGEPGQALRARAQDAARLYLQGIAPRLVFSGGLGEHPPEEAVVGCRIAVSLGVPPGACLMETGSHSTAENAHNTAQLLRARGWTDVVVVSDPYHLLRARQLFRREGLEVATSPALLTPRHRWLLTRVLWTLREVAAFVRSPGLLVQGPAR